MDALGVIDSVSGVKGAVHDLEVAVVNAAYMSAVSVHELTITQHRAMARYWELIFDALPDGPRSHTLFHRAQLHDDAADALEVSVKPAEMFKKVKEQRKKETE